MEPPWSRALLLGYDAIFQLFPFTPPVVKTFKNICKMAVGAAVWEYDWTMIARRDSNFSGLKVFDVTHTVNQSTSEYESSDASDML
jgi:hypothetical protein